MKLIDCSKSILTEDEIKEIIGDRKFIPLSVVRHLIYFHDQETNPYHKSRHELFTKIFDEISENGLIESEIKQEAREIPTKNFPFKGV